MGSEMCIRDRQQSYPQHQLQQQQQQQQQQQHNPNWQQGPQGFYQSGPPMMGHEGFNAMMGKGGLHHMQGQGVPQQNMLMPAIMPPNPRAAFTDGAYQHGAAEEQDSSGI